MSDQLTQKIQQDFDRIALLQPVQWNHNNHYHSFLLKQLPPHCEKILDIGCGTGVFSRLLAQRADQVTAVDLSPKMIEVAQEQSQSYPNIDFQVADILQWQFPVEYFDAIASIATVHHLPLEVLLPKIQAALKPGGKFLILDLVKSEGIQDILSDAIAVPLHLTLQLLKNKRLRPTPEAIAVWQEHGRTDKYLTRSQAKQIYLKSLTEAKIRKHLFWRYSVVWEKSLTAT
ncbi:SAM-dependent methyltransferase [Nostoc sp. T09]|uniref:class I SAM-dependent methyltransferase n=1 Tax=Nostoc sp. T09 TaxID=1932621 RepID=UPI000A3BD98A|nr:class I SAM-dependent methyltransferase [Nostoc sp. T09]OUL21185.1 SAM-dependent methyltransferase [Nostoc sp. T09]